MIKAMVLGALLASVGGYAGAQTITCQQLGQFTQCTQQPAAPVAPIDYWGQLNRPANPDFNSNQAAINAQRLAQQINRNKVGQMMAAGQCEEAKNQALRFADFDLAAQVQSLCKTGQ